MFYITSFCTKLTKYKFRLNIVALIKRRAETEARHVSQFYYASRVFLTIKIIYLRIEIVLRKTSMFYFFKKALFLSLKFLDLNYFNLKSFNLNWFFVRFSRSVISILCVRDQVWLGGVGNGLISEIRVFLPNEKWHLVLWMFISFLLL